MEVSGQPDAPAAVLLVPLDTRLCNPHSQYGHSGEERNLLSLPGIEPQIVQPVAKAG